MRAWCLLLTLAVVGLFGGLVVAVVMVVGLGAEVARLRADLDRRPDTTVPPTGSTTPAPPTGTPPDKPAPKPADPNPDKPTPKQPADPLPTMYDPDVDIFPDLLEVKAGRANIEWESLRAHHETLKMTTLTDPATYEKQKLFAVLLQHRDVLAHDFPTETGATEYLIIPEKSNQWKATAKDKTGGRFNAAFLEHLLGGKVKLPLATTPADKQRLEAERKAHNAAKFPRVPNLSPEVEWDVSILGSRAGVRAVEYDAASGQVRLKLIAINGFDPNTDPDLSEWLKLQLRDKDGEYLSDDKVKEKDQVAFSGYNKKRVEVGEPFTVAVRIPVTVIDRVRKIQLVSAK